MISFFRFMVVYALLGGAALVVAFHSDTEVPINRPFNEFPQTFQSWHMTSQIEFDADTLSKLKPTDYLYRQYVEPGGKAVSLYIGYHGGGKDVGEIHSPKNCLPGSGWYEVSSRRDVVQVSGGTINLVRAVYQKGESRELFLYWFQVRDRTISEEYSLKMAEIVNSAFHRRRDASFIRVSAPVDSDIDQTTARCERLIHDFAPVIREFLPR